MLYSAPVRFAFFILFFSRPGRAAAAAAAARGLAIIAYPFSQLEGALALALPFCPCYARLLACLHLALTNVPPPPSLHVCMLFCLPVCFLFCLELADARCELLRSGSAGLWGMQAHLGTVANPR